jgi:O-antigen ligase
VSRENYDEYIQKVIFWAFVGGCLTIVGFLYYEYYLGHGDVFRTVVVIYTLLNPIYFAMFLSSILLIGLYCFFEKEKMTVSQKTLFQGLGLFFIHYVVFALASRMAILATIAVELGLVFTWQFILKKQFSKGVLWLFIIVIINLISLSTIKQANKRMSNNPIEDPRMLIWETSIIQIAKSPVFGHGSGDSKSIMNEGYKIIGYEYGIKRNRNCHNQYFETLLSTGLVGLLILLGWFFLAFKMGWETQNYVLCIFLAIIALNILTESMLERQQGTYFVAFLGSLLTWKSWQKE